MKQILFILSIYLLLCVISPAANVGSLHFGVITFASDANGKYRKFNGHVAIPESVAPETVEIELVSEGRTLAKWFAQKNQKTVRLTFSVPVENAGKCFLRIILRLPKNTPEGNIGSFETIDLAKDVFGIEPPLK